MKFFELAPSPNNLKVRMALRFKGVEFETVLVDPMDRAPVREASGQDLTPVVVDTARDAVLVDSEAILHYLEANVRGAPRLFPADKDSRRGCDRWKEELDVKVARHWFPVFLYAIQRKDTLDADALKQYQESLAWLDSELGDRSSFQGDDMAICDLRVAEWAVYALPGEGLIKRCPLFKKFQELYAVEPGSLPNLERMLAPWNERLA